MYNSDYLRRYYSSLLFMKETQKEKGTNCSEAFKERLNHLKQVIRHEHYLDEKRYQDNLLQNWHYYEDHGDGYANKIEFFNQYFDSREEAEEWAIDEYKAGQIYADYSPTGQWFVSDVKVAHIQGDLWRCMIKQSLDC